MFEAWDCRILADRTYRIHIPNILPFQSPCCLKQMPPIPLSPGNWRTVDGQFIFGLYQTVLFAQEGHLVGYLKAPGHCDESGSRHELHCPFKQCLEAIYSRAGASPQCSPSSQPFPILRLKESRPLCSTKLPTTPGPSTPGVLPLLNNPSLVFYR